MNGPTRKLIHQELEDIRRNDPNGRIYPASVVEFAKNAATALHREFEWEDVKAAHQHRLDQARAIIRIFLIEHPQGDEPVREYVTIRRDSGYRPVEEVFEASPHDLTLSVLRRMRGLGTDYSLCTEVVEAVNFIDELIAQVELDAVKRRRPRSGKPGARPEANP